MFKEAFSSHLSNFVINADQGKCFPTLYRDDRTEFGCRKVVLCVVFPNFSVNAPLSTTLL